MFDGVWFRPNIHIEDMVDVYMLLVYVTKEKIVGKISIVTFETQPVKELAGTVKSVIREDMTLITTPIDANRSYHNFSNKIEIFLMITSLW